MVAHDYEPWQVEEIPPGWTVLTPELLATLAEDDES